MLVQAALGQPVNPRQATIRFLTRLTRIPGEWDNKINQLFTRLPLVEVCQVELQAQVKLMTALAAMRPNNPKSKDTIPTPEPSHDIPAMTFQKHTGAYEVDEDDDDNFMSWSLSCLVEDMELAEERVLVCDDYVLVDPTIAPTVVPTGPPTYVQSDENHAADIAEATADVTKFAADTANMDLEPTSHPSGPPKGQLTLNNDDSGDESSHCNSLPDLEDPDDDPIFDNESMRTDQEDAVQSDTAPNMSDSNYNDADSVPSYQYITLSSTESEIIGAVDAAIHSRCLIKLFQEFHQPVELPVELRQDNLSAIHMTRNGVNLRRAKHMLIKGEFVRGLEADGSLKMVATPSVDMDADAYTKDYRGRQLVKYTLKHFVELDD